MPTGTRRLAGAGATPGHALVRAVALAAVVVVAGLTGCSSGYQYVKNSDQGAYFKVPEGWTVYEVDAGVPVPDGRPAPLGAGAGGDGWRVVFDASPEPSPEHVDGAQPVHPTGQAEVGELSNRVRDEVSLSFLRSLAVNGEADPVELLREGDDRVEIVRYDEIEQPDGLYGNRIVVNVKLEEGGYTTIDQTALVDPGVDRIYRFLVKCESSCFEANQAEIDAVVDSFTVRPRT